MEDFLIKKDFGNQTQWLKKHGDRVWELICDCCQIDEEYTYKEVAKKIFPHCGPNSIRAYPVGGGTIGERNTDYVTSTQTQLVRLVRLVVRNLEAEYVKLLVQDPELWKEIRCPVDILLGKGGFRMVP